MKIDGAYRPSIALTPNGRTVEVIDQRWLPWRFEMIELSSAALAVQGIREMWVRGAPLIGVTAAYGLCLALYEDASDEQLASASRALLSARPTAVNLAWAVERVRRAAAPLTGAARVTAAYACAATIRSEDIASSLAIAAHGFSLITAMAERRSKVNILTHCNAGALAAVEHGTALAPIFRAHDAGVSVHVWVSETRPRNQGASLTAFELSQHEVPHTVITDNAGGILMQQGKVDLCFVGADRVARNGDVCNKVGTYLKALAARDNDIGFYALFPYSTFDPALACGEEIEIEHRSSSEVSVVQGRAADGQVVAVTLTQSPALNPAFDITPARLMSGYITERGLVERWQPNLQ